MCWLAAPAGLTLLKGHQLSSNMAAACELLGFRLMQQVLWPDTGSSAAFAVFEQASAEVTALAVQLLPAAALTPGTVLDRLLADAVQHSGQVPMQ